MKLNVMKYINLIKWTFVFASIVACVDIEGPSRESMGPSDVLAQIKIRSEAIMIAKGDSHRIDFDLIAMNEDAIEYDKAHIKWSTLESQTVPITSDGVIYGREISRAPIRIIASYEHRNVTKLDTVSVYVTDGRIDANEIRFTSIDSNRIGAHPLTGYPRVRVDLYKDGLLVEKGSLIPIQVDPPVTVTADPTGGPDAEPVYRVNNDRLLIGNFLVRASLNLYGNVVTDSLSFTGLYGSMVAPIIVVGDLPEGYNAPLPLLDTIPMRTAQLCSNQFILNMGTVEFDVLFSDSTESSTSCGALPAGASGLLGFPGYGEFIGGNVLRIPPGKAAIRKSRTDGVISYSVRYSSTQEIIPWFIGRRKQIDVQD